MPLSFYKSALHALSALQQNIVENYHLPKTPLSQDKNQA